MQGDSCDGEGKQARQEESRPFSSLRGKRKDRAELEMRNWKTLAVPGKVGIFSTAPITYRNREAVIHSQISIGRIFNSKPPRNGELDSQDVLFLFYSKKVKIQNSKI